MSRPARAEERARRAVTMTPQFEVSDAQLTTMACLLRRLGMADVHAPGDMGNLAPYASTHHLWKVGPWPTEAPAGVTWATLRQGQNGSHLSSLYIWGFLNKLATTAPKAEITPKGWAYLVFKGIVPWDHVIHLKRASSDFVQLVHELIDRFKAREALKASVSVESLDALVGGVIQDITEGKTLFDNIPYQPLDQEFGEFRPHSGTTITVTPEETRITLTRPQYDDVTLEAWKARSADEKQMRLAREALVRKWKGPEFGNDETVLDHAIQHYLTPLEVLEADWSAMQDRQGAWWRRELVERMSIRGAFHTPTLADHAGGDPLLRGVHRIAAGIEAGELGRAGIEMGLPPETTTLGDVHDRLTRESVARQSEETDDWGRNIDELPIVDWIEATMDKAVSNQDSEPFVLLDEAKKIARQAVLRSMHERIGRSPLTIPEDVMTHRSAWHKALEFNRDCAAPASEDMDDRGYWQHEIDVFDRTFDELTKLAANGDIPPEDLQSYYDGHRYHVLQRNLTWMGRQVVIDISVMTDNDEADNAAFESYMRNWLSGRGDQNAPRIIGKHPALGHPYAAGDGSPPPDDIYQAVADEIGVTREEAKRRFLWMGYGGRMELQRVGQVATLKARWGVPVWAALLCGALGGAVTLAGFLGFLSFVVR